MSGALRVRMAKRPAAKVHSDLDVWQLCSELRRLVLLAIRKGPAASDYRFRSQLRASVRSACNLVTEGFYRKRDPEFLNYLLWSRASLGEAADQINDGFESGYFTADQQSQMITLVKRAFSANRALRAYLDESIEKKKRNQETARSVRRRAQRKHPSP